MSTTRALGALILATSLSVAACGSGEDATPAVGPKTIEVSMTDNEFTPSSFDVEVGQEVTFEFTNDGTVEHEAILGSEAEQAEHGAEMMGGDADGGDMEGMDHGDGPGSEAITVEPGDTATMTTTFDAAGTVILGCHVPGHYEAGMKATITVS